MGAVLLLLAVVVVLVLNAVGVVPLFGHTTSNPAGPSTFSGWRSVAQQTADGYPGGGWTLVSGFAMTYTGPSIVRLDTPFVRYRATGCEGGLSASEPQNASISGLANLSQGLSYDWFYGFLNASGTGVLIVGVIGGEVSVLGALSGPGCSSKLSGKSFAPLGPNVIDSSAASRSFGMAGAYAKLDANPPTEGVLGVEGEPTSNGTGSGFVWGLFYTDCGPVNGTLPISGPTYIGTVDALSGALLTETDASVGCGSP